MNNHLWQLHNFRIWLLLTNIFRQKITMLKRSTWLRTLMSVCSTAGPHLCSRLHWLPLNTFLHRKLPHGKLFRSTPCVGSPETHPRHQKDRLILNHHDLVPVAMKPMQITNWQRRVWTESLLLCLSLLWEVVMQNSRASGKESAKMKIQKMSKSSFLHTAPSSLCPSSVHLLTLLACQYLLTRMRRQGRQVPWKKC